MNDSRHYLFSPIIIFIIVGLLLLVGVILAHGAINRGFGWSRWLHGTLSASVAKTAFLPAPDYVVNEVTRSGVNIAGTVGSCADRPSLVSQLICEHNRSTSASSFITQE